MKLILKNNKEVTNMKKTLLAVCLVVAVAFFITGYADANVTGKKCSTCHTMHNSQDGQSVTTDGFTKEFLIKLSFESGKTPCWGCHATSDATTIDSTTGAPMVHHSDTNDLAGGNFSYITGTGSTGSQMTRGHNVTDTGVTDTNFASGTYPPGDEFSQSLAGFDNSKFTCAGVYGCHGDRTATNEYSAIKGAHHYVDDELKFGTIDESAQAQTTGTNGEQVGSSYRMLKGVKGGEDSDWQDSESASDHNEYKGASSPTEGTVSSPGGNTISGLCSECHGNFHGSSDIGGTSSPFERHPTDIVLPDTGEYQYYNPDATTPGEYSLEAPVARQTIPTTASSSSVSKGSGGDVVMCLSCHRAHASPYEDMLRWDYNSMQAGSSTSDTGCFVCHTTKNADEDTY